MIRLKMWYVLLAVLAVLIVACDEPGELSPSPSTFATEATTPAAESVTLNGMLYFPDPETTVTIGKIAYTCSQLIGSCDAELQVGFDLWSQNIDNYVNSGRLNLSRDISTNRLSYGLAAKYGITACIHALQDMSIQVFAQGVYDNNGEPLPSADIEKLWSGAKSFLCPDVVFPPVDTRPEFKA